MSCFELLGSEQLCGHVGARQSETLNLTSRASPHTSTAFMNSLNWQQTRDEIHSRKALLRAFAVGSERVWTVPVGRWSSGAQQAGTARPSGWSGACLGAPARSFLLSPSSEALQPPLALFLVLGGGLGPGEAFSGVSVCFRASPPRSLLPGSACCSQRAGEWCALGEEPSWEPGSLELGSLRPLGREMALEQAASASKRGK